MSYLNVINLVKSTKEIVFNKDEMSKIITKGYADFVTGIDLAVQNYLRDKLAVDFPNVQFMGEEGDHNELDMTKPIWILDPIDGTSNLIHNLNLSAVSLALVENDKPVFAVVYNPFTDELFTAERGKGAYYNGERIYVSDKRTMRECFVSVGTSPYDDDLRKKSVTVIKNLLDNCIDVRRLGAASLDLCYLAAGKFDCFYEQVLRPWDFAAGELIIEEAGGKITGLLGEVLHHDKNSGVLASNGLCHNDLLEIVNMEN